MTPIISIASLTSDAVCFDQIRALRWSDSVSTRIVTLRSLSICTTSSNEGKLHRIPCFHCCRDKTLKRILSYFQFYQ